jgi:hydrogenase expression/formation protein HypE
MAFETIQLEHGGGGRLARELIQGAILSRFGDGPLKGLPDAATVRLGDCDIVYTTDSFVVSPLEFPGGNIGDLAVHGSVNDVAVAGGRPLWLSVGLVLEEGLPGDLLAEVLDSLASAARDAGVTVATGDTKVVERGKCDGMFINTSCIGERIDAFSLGSDRILPGDVVLASGSLGDHGMAIMSCRNSLSGRGPVSDTASVWPFVEAVLPFAQSVRFMRDPTRGGAAAVLNEMVENRSDAGIVLDEESLPVSARSAAIADILGLDILHSASEGRIIAVCAAEVAAEILAAWRTLQGGEAATTIGRIVDDPPMCGLVSADTITGGRRIVDVPRGELLPRIC